MADILLSMVVFVVELPLFCIIKEEWSGNRDFSTGKDFNDVIINLLCSLKIFKVGIEFTMSLAILENSS